MRRFLQSITLAVTASASLSGLAQAQESQELQAREGEGFGQTPLRGAWVCHATPNNGERCGHYASGYFEEVVRIRADLACMSHHRTSCHVTCWRR